MRSDFRSTKRVVCDGFYQSVLVLPSTSGPVDMTKKQTRQTKGFPGKQAFVWLLKAAGHDFCPNWRIFDLLKHPLGWVGVAIVFSLLVGLFVGPQGYVLSFVFLSLLVLGLVWPWLSMKGIRCELVLPDRRVTENQEVDVIFRVKNYWPLPVFGMMVKGDFLQDVTATDDLVAFSLRRVPALSEKEFRMTVTPRRRGRLPTGQVCVTNGFPFGLIDIAKPIEKHGCTLVWPKGETLTGCPSSSSTRFAITGALRDRSGHEGETIGVRCYRQGDRMRSIHWAQTVRSRRLMVRERQTRSSTSATVLLDLSPQHHQGQGSSNSFECAIRIAATVCSYFHDERSPVRLVCLGLQENDPGTVDNRRGLEPLMDFLAELPDLESLRSSVRWNEEEFRHCYSRHSGGRQFLICTSGSNRLLESVSSETQHIVIELRGHIKGSEREKQKSNEMENGRSSLDTGALIVEAEVGASQLVGLWSGSFNHAV